MSDIPAGLETLDFSFSGGRPAGAFAPVLACLLYTSDAADE